MPSFYILRMQTEDAGMDPILRTPQIQLKFFPIRAGDNTPIELTAETPELAHWLARQRFPYLRFYLSVQEKISYDITINRLKSLTNARSETGSPNPQATHFKRRGYPASRVAPVSIED